MTQRITVSGPAIINGFVAAEASPVDLTRRLEDAKLLGAFKQRAKAAGGDVVHHGPSLAQRRRQRHRRRLK